MTGTFCLGTVKCKSCNIYLRKKEHRFGYLPSFCETFCPKDLHEQPILSYCWHISREWERLRGMTTQIYMGDWHSICQCNGTMFDKCDGDTHFKHHC